MDDKKQEKSFDILVDVKQLLNEKAPTIYQGRTPAWRKFFQSWARRTLEQDYFETLVNHRISLVAFAILKQAPLRRGQDAEVDIFLKGVAYGVEMLYGDIKQASTKQQKED
jgi:hypothetical protein